MATPRSPYQTLLHERGFRVTPQRQLILDILRECGRHVAPEEIYARARRKAPTVNRATVYRNLDFLCALHLITCADVGSGGKVYELAAAQPHHHLVCRQCGAVAQLDHALVKTFFAKIARACQFTVDTDHLALFGLCQKCRQAK